MVDRRGGTITLNFADCHTECDQPDAVRSVYLVDGNVNDNDILNGTILFPSSVGILALIKNLMFQKE